MSTARDIAQSITGLEAAYEAVFNRPLRDRVAELAAKYPDNLDNVCTELNPDGVVPCFWALSELAEHYAIMECDR